MGQKFTDATGIEIYFVKKITGIHLHILVFVDEYGVDKRYTIEVFKSLVYQNLLIPI